MSHIPTVDSLDKIYDEKKILSEGVRYNNLVIKFETVFGRAPEFITRSPGRVNLIGEHIDYAGFGVLPMAVDRDVIMAVATHHDNSKIRIANVSDKYPKREFDFEGKDEVVTIDSTVLEWSNYFKCGYKGMLQRAKLDKPKGMSILVDGNVPAGSGLSSSAAFVCSSALAVITANKFELTKKELTEIAIVAERNVGVNSGGMDQSASVFGERDMALYVEFIPTLKVTPVRFPITQPKLAFVIANTLVVADKHITAPTNYNLRVVETNIGALHLSRVLHLEKERDTYKDVMDAYFYGKDLGVTGEVNVLKKQLEEMIEIVDRHFEDKVGYTRQGMAELVKIEEEELVKRYMSRFPVKADLFRLHQRAKHVYGEALRVVLFRDVCEKPPSSSADVFKALGDLMNASQESCRDLYNCSCPEIDELTAIARAAGAYGSRLTGAGWGGCTVSLVAEDNVPAFIKVLKEKYYHKKFPELTAEEVDDAIIATKPGSGAVVYNGF